MFGKWVEELPNQKCFGMNWDLFVESEVYYMHLAWRRSLLLRQSRRRVFSGVGGVGVYKMWPLSETRTKIAQRC